MDWPQDKRLYGDWGWTTWWWPWRKKRVHLPRIESTLEQRRHVSDEEDRLRKALADITDQYDTIDETWLERTLQSDFRILQDFDPRFLRNIPSERKSEILAELQEHHRPKQWTPRV